MGEVDMPCRMKVFVFSVKVKRSTPTVWARRLTFSHNFAIYDAYIDNVLETMKQQAQSVLVGTMGKVAKLAKREFIGEREGKHLYHAEQPDMIIQEFISSMAGIPEETKKNSNVQTLNALRNEISSYLFEYVDGFRIPTHFVSKLSDTEMLVRPSDPLAVSVRVYN